MPAIWHGPPRKSPLVARQRSGVRGSRVAGRGLMRDRRAEIARQAAAIGRAGRQTVARRHASRPPVKRPGACLGRLFVAQLRRRGRGAPTPHANVTCNLGQILVAPTRACHVRRMNRWLPAGRAHTPGALLALILLLAACAAGPPVAVARATPDSFAPLVKRVLPSVVNIAVTETVSGKDAAERGAARAARHPARPRVPPQIRRQARPRPPAPAPASSSTPAASSSPTTMSSTTPTRSSSRCPTAPSCRPR